MAHTGTGVNRAAGWMLGAAVALSAAPQTGRACSADCVPGYFLPAAGSIVPANAPALVWRFGDGDGYARGGAKRVHVQRLQGQGGWDVAFHSVDRVGESWLVLDEPLLEGATYRLSEDGECTAPDAEFTVGPPAPLPQAFGELTLTALGPRPVETSAFGSCSAPVAAVVVTTGVELSAEAEPWTALLLFTVMLDGGPYPPRGSRLPRPLPRTAETTIYAECPALYPLGRERDDEAPRHGVLAEGEHTVWLEAHVPGVEEVRFSATQQVSLNCPAGGPIDGTGVPKGSNLGPWGGSDETDSGSGCSLERARRDSSAAALLALLGLGTAWLRRRGLAARTAVE